MKKLLLMIMTLLFTLTAFGECNLEFDEPTYLKSKYEINMEKIIKKKLRKKGYTFNNNIQGTKIGYDSFYTGCSQSKGEYVVVVNIQDNSTGENVRYVASSGYSFFGSLLSNKGLLKRALKQVPKCKLANKL